MSKDRQTQNNNDIFSYDVWQSGRILDSDKNRQKMVTKSRSLDLEKNAKDQLEEQSNKCICSWKSEERKIHTLDTIWQLQHRWLGYVRRNEINSYCKKLLKAEWRTKHSGNMLSDLAISTKYVEVKRAAEDWERWRTTNRRGMLQTCYTADH